MTTLTLPASADALYTPEDLLELDGDGLFELVDGKLLEKRMSFLAGKATICIAYSLKKYLETSPVGEAVSEVTFQCFPNNPSQVRRPDIAFVAAERAAAIPPQGHVRRRSGPCH